MPRGAAKVARKAGPAVKTGPKTRTTSTLATAIAPEAKRQRSRGKAIQRGLEDAAALQRLRAVRIKDATGEEYQTGPAIYEGPSTMKQQISATKRALTDPQGIVPGYGYAMVTDDDIKHIIQDQTIRRTWEEEAAILSMFNPSDPAHNEILHRILPDYFKNREIVIDIISEYQKMAAKINLHGLRTEDDARFMAKMKMLNVPKDEHEWPKVLSKGVHLMNYSDVSELGLTSDDRLKGVDLTQLFSKAEDDGIKRARWGWIMGAPPLSKSLTDYGKPYIGERGHSYGVGAARPPLTEADFI